jgi:glycosyltransferase involved in cell wall biosynthesis
VRIGLLAPPFECVPPIGYGGTERVVAFLADALVERGHDVTLFASGESQTRARLSPIVERAVWRDPRYGDERPFQVMAAACAYSRAIGLDVMHNHMDYAAWPEARRSAVPTVTTLHWRLDPPELAPLYREFEEQRLISISDAQRAPCPDAAWMATVYHGYPRDHYRPRIEGGRYLAFCGRCAPEKGLDRAIAVAVAAGMPIRIAAPRPPEHSTNPVLREQWDYYQRALVPYLDHPLVEYVGEIADHEKQELYEGALALLFPIDWPEPFGLVMIEALACGTPVLATPRGSVPEIVRDGETGFLSESIADFVAAVDRVGALDRAACRRDFERRFTADVMADAYERVYERVIADPAPRLVAAGAAEVLTTPPGGQCESALTFGK